jgi:hypothetical protein
MHRLHTDFLVADSSFLIGAAMIFNLGGNFPRFNLSATPAQADARAIRQDFAMIGQDIRDVAAQLEKEKEKQMQLGL